MYWDQQQPQDTCCSAVRPLKALPTWRLRLCGLSVCALLVPAPAQVHASRCTLTPGLSLAMQLVGVRECNICVVAGGNDRPKGLKDEIRAVRAEWLLAAAETLTKPNVTFQYLIDTD